MDNATLFHSFKGLKKTHFLSHMLYCFVAKESNPKQTILFGHADFGYHGHKLLVISFQKMTAFLEATWLAIMVASNLHFLLMVMVLFLVFKVLLLIGLFVLKNVALKNFPPPYAL
jgi:hypothetical protein